MDSLDEKLREIVEEAYDETGMRAGVDNTITQIKQAFQDEGYHQSRPMAQKIDPVHEGYKQLRDTHEGKVTSLEASPFCMTGQDWLNRFKKELGTTSTLTISPNEEPLIVYSSVTVNESAKKASGIKDE